MKTHSAKQIFSLFSIGRAAFASVGSLALAASLPNGLQATAGEVQLHKQLIISIQGLSGNEAILQKMLAMAAPDRHAGIIYYLQSDAELRGLIDAQNGDAEFVRRQFAAKAGLSVDGDADNND